MDSEEVYLYVNGMRYSGWQSVSISRALEAIAGSFEVALTDRWEVGQEPWPIRNGDQVRVAIGADTVITGFVDAIGLSLGIDQHSLSVSGRDATCDLVDCSVMNSPGEWRQSTMAEIMEALCKPFGVPVMWEQEVEGSIPVFRVQPGESVFSALERLAKACGVLLSSSPAGAVVITLPGGIPSGARLVEGVNIKSADLQCSSAERFSQYTIEGQGDGSDTARIRGRANALDPGVKRYRPLRIVAEDQATAAYLQKRADWELKTRAAAGQSATVQVVRWRMPDGKLWTVNRTVEVEIPSCRMYGTYLITDVQYTKGEDGTQTTLALKSPDAYAAEPLSSDRILAPKLPKHKYKKAKAKMVNGMEAEMGR